jgi:L-threonylcarbamoyladenylate synthase
MLQRPGIMPSESAEILSTETAQLFEAAIKRASELLRAGQVVGLPTETVYGLAANALDAEAVARIFQVKGRPSHNPVIVHVASLEMAVSCVQEWPKMAERLARAFWPGPLTLVLPRSGRIPDIVTAGGPTVGLRWPSHPFIRAVIQRCGFPLAAPSANLSNRVSPTNARHVWKQLGAKIPLIIDGGHAQVGIESTVLDLSVSPPRVLRPGMVHDHSIMAVTGELAGTLVSAADRKLKSPGLLEKHYSPRARLIQLTWSDESDLLAQVDRLAIERSKTQIIAHSHIPAGDGFAGVSVIPHDAEAFARALYSQFHECDDTGAEWIIVEAVPASPEWRGISDRLSRAARD